jgi:hypothetical protein
MGNKSNARVRSCRAGGVHEADEKKSSDHNILGVWNQLRVPPFYIEIIEIVTLEARADCQDCHSLHHVGGHHHHVSRGLARLGVHGREREREQRERERERERESDTSDFQCEKRNKFTVTYDSTIKTVGGVEGMPEFR